MLLSAPLTHGQHARVVVRTSGHRSHSPGEYIALALRGCPVEVGWRDPHESRPRFKPDRLMDRHPAPGGQEVVDEGLSVEGTDGAHKRPLSLIGTPAALKITAARDDGRVALTAA